MLLRFFNKVFFRSRFCFINLWSRGRRVCPVWAYNEKREQGSQDANDQSFF